MVQQVQWAREKYLEVWNKDQEAADDRQQF